MLLNENNKDHVFARVMSYTSFEAALQQQSAWSSYSVSCCDEMKVIATSIFLHAVQAMSNVKPLAVKI